MKVNDTLIQRYQARWSKYRNEVQAKDSWDQLRVEIYDASDPTGEKRIGEYLRNYSSMYNTFHPFEQDGKHYALYSRDYTSTRVMTLPDCQDLCGEERDSFGFCPTGYAVPHFNFEWQGPTDDPTDPEPTDNPHWAGKQVIDEGYVQVIDKQWCRPGDTKYTGIRTKEEFQARFRNYKARSEAWNSRHPYQSDPFNARFGFVCGCIWGDDTSWKIQFLDLSQINKGILTRDDRFGYIELLKGADSLKDAIEMDDWTPEEPHIEIACRRTFRTTENVKEVKE